MSKEHFDVLAIFERLLVSPGLGDVASDIACGFMDASSDLPRGCVFGQQREPS